MEFNQLESFIKVVKYKSFSQAAKILYLSQPAVSNNIKNLEKELETRLLDRKSKTISLTSSGEVFYKYALELINLRDECKFHMMEQANTLEGEIQINASSIPEEYLLPHIIKEFCEIYPNISFSVSNRDSEDIIDDILKGRENFGIVGLKHNSKNLDYIDFYEDELVLALSFNSSCPHNEDDFFSIDSLLEKKFIFRNKGSGTRQLVEKALSDKGISLDDLDIVSLVDSNIMIKKMVELELGVSFLSYISIENELELKLIKPVRVENLDLKRSFYFVYNKNRTLSPQVKLFKDFLRDYKLKK